MEEEEKISDLVRFLEAAGFISEEESYVKARRLGVMVAGYFEGIRKSQVENSSELIWPLMAFLLVAFGQKIEPPKTDG